MMKLRIKERFDNLVKNALNAFNGRIILKLKLDQQLGFVIYLFFLVSLFITWSLTVESSMARVQDYEKEIKELRINYQQRTLELVGMNNRSKIDRMLKEKGSKLRQPDSPPARIEKERR